MKCKVCETDLEKLVKGGYYCPKCEDVFEVDDKGKQSPVKDKKDFFAKLHKHVTGKLKELSNKFGFSADDEGGEDERDFWD